MLLDSELDRIRFELGFNLLNVGAEPWIGVTQIFELVVQKFMRSGALTTSSTVVAASDSGYAPQALVLADGTGFHANPGDKVVIDVDSRQEVVTCQSFVGNTLTVQLVLAHGPTYPVTVEGGESIIRECLRNIRDTKKKMSETYGSGSLKSVDSDISFYDTGGQTAFGVLGQQLRFWRCELASAIGIMGMWGIRGRGGSECSVY